MTLAEAQAAVDAATIEHTEACTLYQEISRRRTSALNRLNDAQKQFDAAVAEYRKGSPAHDSDWNRSKGTPI